MRFLLLLSQSHLDFRIAELEGICRSLNIDVDISTLIDSSSPIQLVDIDNIDVIRKLLSRSILLKTAYEFMFQTANYDDLRECVLQRAALFQPFNVPEQTWQLRVRPVGRKKKVDIIRRARDFSHFLPLKDAPVSMKNTNNKFVILEHYPSDTAEEPEVLYFLREISDGQGTLRHKINLKDRCYIGNTTMDPELALLQSNICAVRPNTLVLDPFCGTGGLLIPAAEYGGVVIGTEINYQVAHAQGRSSRHNKDKLTNESVSGSFKQYGTERRFLSVIVADTSRHGLWTRRPIFDSIVADPPYGIREKSRRIGYKDRKEHWTLPGCDDHPQHFPEKEVYELDSVFEDLVDLAASSLVVGGRLSFWFPVIMETYSEDVLPAHPALRLVSNCEQRLTLRTSRRLLTYEKLREPECSERAQTAFNQYSDRTFRDVFFNTREPKMNSNS